MYNPWQHADALGLGVQHVPRLPELGLYEGGTIYLREGLSHRTERCVLAHEVAHAVNGDEPTNDPCLYARREHRADRDAARRLITEADLRDVSAGTDDIGAWALDLHVTGWILEARLKDFAWHT